MQQRYPQLQIRGENYPAPKRNQVLAKILSTVKFALLALIVLGEYVQLFQRLEIDPPSAYVWAKENKVRIPWHYFWLVSSYIWEGKRRKFYFWTPGLPEGSLVIALVHPWSVRSSLNISETAHWFFLIFCMKLGHYKGTKVTEPDF